MRLHELMDPRIGTVSANDYAAEALLLMNARNLGWCFVLDRNEVTGIIQAKDLDRIPETVLKERDVREFVRGNLPTVNIDAEVQEAERLLRRSGQRWLGILRNNLPVGILSQDAFSLEDGYRQSTLARPANQRLAC